MNSYYITLDMDQLFNYTHFQHFFNENDINKEIDKRINKVCKSM